MFEFQLTMYVVSALFAIGIFVFALTKKEYELAFVSLVSLLLVGAVAFAHLYLNVSFGGL